MGWSWSPYGFFKGVKDFAEDTVSNIGDTFDEFGNVITGKGFNYDEPKLGVPGAGPLSDYSSVPPSQGGYDVDQITSQIQTLLDTGEDPAIEAEYRKKLGEGYRDAEMGAAARGVTGYGGVQRSKASVRREADIAKSRASMQQKQMNQQLAVQWTQQLLSRNQLTQEGALAMAEIQLGGIDWIHANNSAMAKHIPEIQQKVAQYLEKNPNDYMGAATLYSKLFNEAFSKSGVYV